MRLDPWAAAAAASAIAATSVLPSQIPAFGPAPRSFDQFCQWQRIESAIKRYWYGLDGFATSERDDIALSEASGEFGSTYGECTPDGGRAIFAAIGLYDAAKGSVFADLGSGVGKLAVQAYLECPIERAIAIELSETRHLRALRAWALLVASDDVLGELDKSRDGLCFQCDDALDANLEHVTHAFVSNLCFDQAADEALAVQLSRSRSIRRFATLRPLLDCQGFELVAQIKARMSWNPVGAGTDIYTYQRYY